MVLDRACSLEAFRGNIAEEVRAGKDSSQAAAIAHDTLRDGCRESGMSVPRTDAADEGLQVRRYDTGEFSSPVRTHNGYLRADASITRVGVFAYKQADGTTRNELRLPAEVFNADSMRSFEDVPLTNNHPRERLTAKNTKRFQAGNVKNPRQRKDHLAAQVLITDDSAILDAEAGKTQLSCGYTCDLDFTPGVTSGIDGVPDGLRFDAVQRNIIGNHVAIVDKGRAGASATLHLDDADAVMVEPIATKTKPTGSKPGPVGGKAMKQVRIDGVDFEMSEQAAQAVSKIAARMDELGEKVDGLGTQVSEQTARADKAEEDLEAAKKLHTDDMSGEKVQVAVRARVALETVAAKVLKDDSIKLDNMSDTDLRKAVVVKVSPAAKDKLDGADEAYVSARFDAAVEAWEKADAEKPTASQRARGGATIPADRMDSASARQRMIEANINLGRSPVRATAAPEQ